MVTHESQNIFCTCTWSSNQSGGGAILALSSFFNQIPRQKEPEISVGIFSPTWRQQYPAVWVLLTTTMTCLIYFPPYDWHSFRNLMPLIYEVFHSESKIDLKLQCDCCIKFQLFKGAQDVFSRLTAICCMLLPHNPYVLPQHYKRHVCGFSCSCKHRFLWVSPIFEH